MLSSHMNMRKSPQLTRFSTCWSNKEYRAYHDKDQLESLKRSYVSPCCVITFSLECDALHLSRLEDSLFM